MPTGVDDRKSSQSVNGTDPIASVVYSQSTSGILEFSIFMPRFRGLVGGLTMFTLGWMINLIPKVECSAVFDR